MTTPATTATPRTDASATARVSYIDPASKYRVVGTFKVGDVLPDGRTVIQIDENGGGNVATLRRPKTDAPASAPVATTTAPPAKAASTKKPKAPKPAPTGKVADVPAPPAAPRDNGSGTGAAGATDAANRGGNEDAMNVTTNKNNASKTSTRKPVAAKAKTAAKAKAATTTTTRKAKAPVSSDKVLTDAQVAESWKLRKGDPKKWTYPALGEKFGVTEHHVYHRMHATLGAKKDPTRTRPA